MTKSELDVRRDRRRSSSQKFFVCRIVEFSTMKNKIVSFFDRKHNQRDDESGDYRHGDVQMYYEREGNGEPLLLLHGVLVATRTGSTQDLMSSYRNTP
jgi:hypothetical protein